MIIREVFIDAGLISMGAITGSLLRHQIYKKIPLKGTIFVNTLGSLLIGISAANNINSKYKLIFATGFCASFTTFSTFALETVQLTEKVK